MTMGPLGHRGFGVSGWQRGCEGEYCESMWGWRPDRCAERGKGGGGASVHPW